MTKPPIISRRLLLAGFWLAGTSPLWAQVKRGTDQGIGGTGITRGDDHGIGGTGSNPAAARVARMPRDILHPPIVREAGSDVVVGFSRPYASIASSATD